MGSEACGWVYFTLLAAIYPLLLAELVWGMAYLIAKQRTERRVKVSTCACLWAWRPRVNSGG